MELITYTKSTHTQILDQGAKLICIILLILSTGVLFIPSRIATAQTVHIPDQNLRAALESALGKKAGAEISQVDMASLESFDAFGSRVRNITGLEYAINLSDALCSHGY